MKYQLTIISLASTTLAFFPIAPILPVPVPRPVAIPEPVPVPVVIPVGGKPGVSVPAISSIKFPLGTGGAPAWPKISLPCKSSFVTSVLLPPPTGAPAVAPPPAETPTVALPPPLPMTTPCESSAAVALPPPVESASVSSAPTVPVALPPPVVSMTAAPAPALPPPEAESPMPCQSSEVAPPAAVAASSSAVVVAVPPPSAPTVAPLPPPAELPITNSTVPLYTLPTATESAGPLMQTTNAGIRHGPVLAGVLGMAGAVLVL